MPGWPDLQFAGPGGRMAFLELKRRGGRLNEAQAAMRDHLAETPRHPARRDYPDRLRARHLAHVGFGGIWRRWFSSWDALRYELISATSPPSARGYGSRPN